MTPLLLFSLFLGADLSAQKTAMPPTLDKHTMLIEPKARADDLIQAYESFKREKPTSSIAARLANGQILTNLQELTAMSNGTLFLVKISTSIGPKTQVLSVDEIVDFFYP